jgi:copper oxidase (laccase) domain-containing protein
MRARHARRLTGNFGRRAREHDRSGRHAGRELAGLAWSRYRHGRWQADVYRLARLRLITKGITAIYGGDLCTYSNPAQFFLYRRNGASGRMVSLNLLMT